MLDLWWRSQRCDNPPDYSPSPIIVGLWLCGQILDGGASALATFLSARTALVAALDSQRADIFLKTPTASCYALAILRGLGYQTSGLEGFAATVSKALARTPRAADSALEYHETRRILWRLGLASKPALVSPMQVARILEHTTPVVSRQETDRLVAAVAAATDYGTRPIAAVIRERGEFDELLLGLAMYEIRQYDLDLGTRLLRSVLYLQMHKCAAFSACQEFIYLQQRPDGPFGFFGPIVNSEASIGRLDEALRVLVPTTLSCLLVLAESDQRGWRLAAALDGWPQTLCGG